MLTYNYRAKGGLCALPSALFYYGMMEQAPVEPSLDEVGAWHRWLLKYCPRLKEDSQRVLVEVCDTKSEESSGGYINRGNVEYVCEMVCDAVKDENLKGAGKNKDELKIEIITFWDSQVLCYASALRDMVSAGQLTADERKQIIVCTVERATEADAVFIDYVRDDHPGITVDRRVLCTTMTRARHAEVHVMDPGIVPKGLFMRPEETPSFHDGRLLSAIYQDVSVNSGILTKGLKPGYEEEW